MKLAMYEHSLHSVCSAFKHLSLRLGVTGAIVFATWWSASTRFLVLILAQLPAKDKHFNERRKRLSQWRL